jgi:hypothetical protein
MSRIVEKWMDAKLVYEQNVFLRVLMGSWIRSVIKLIPENQGWYESHLLGDRYFS